MIFKLRKVNIYFSIIRTIVDVPLTQNVYKHIVRKSFASVVEEDINFFRNILNKNRVLTEDSDVESYNTDWMRSYRGESKVILLPKTAEEISEILKYCNSRRLSVVPQGGNTGLVGGSVPVFDEIVISSNLMNKIYSIDEISGNVVTQAGVVLEKLESEVNKYNMCMPLDLGSKGTCQIGGNLSTNAGGIRLLRYGSLHGNVLGLKVVLPNGDILDCLTNLRKDNTGYDLKQLFIGAEGTLGIITDVSIFCPAKPTSVNVGYFGCSTFDDVLKIFKIAKCKLGEILSAFELMDNASITCVTENLTLKSPLQSKHNFYVLVETSGSNQGHDQEKLNAFLTETMGNGYVQDGIVAQDLNQMKKIWEIRENVNRSCQQEDGYVYKFDYTVHISEARLLIDLAKKEFNSENILRLVGYGHVGDGNLHLNLVTNKFCSDFNKKLETFVYSWLRDHRGSISAEHGIGFKKRPYLHYSKSAESIKYMKQIKDLFDPNGIMNPYKVLSDDHDSNNP